MALVDFEAVVLDLVAEMEGRQGIGRNQLFALIKRLEAKHQLDEGVAERAFRLYGVALGEDLRAAARGEAVVIGEAASSEDGHDPAVGTRSLPGGGTSNIEGEQHVAGSEDRRDRSRRAAAAVV